MLNITIGEKEYTLEYSFMAAENKDLMQKMFNVISGAYLFKHVASVGENASAESEAVALANGSAEMVSEIPHIVKTAFYSGLLENYSISEEESNDLLKQYMKENKVSFYKMYDMIKSCMEEDGFFDLSGLTDMMESMNQAVEVKSKRPSKKK